MTIRPCFRIGPASAFAKAKIERLCAPRRALNPDQYAAQFSDTYFFRGPNVLSVSVCTIILTGTDRLAHRNLSTNIALCGRIRPDQQSALSLTLRPTDHRVRRRSILLPNLLSTYPPVHRRFGLAVQAFASRIWAGRTCLIVHLPHDSRRLGHACSRLHAYDAGVVMGGKTQALNGAVGLGGGACSCR